MFNAEKPSLEELPTTQQLIRSTLIAAVSALVILITVILPAEYAVDPIGVGRLLGLTEMGEIKQELESEAEEDRVKHDLSEGAQTLPDRFFALFVSQAHASDAWKDTVTFTLEPGEWSEIKMVMRKGDAAQYRWHSTGGRINFDLHGHGGGQSVTYEKGRGETEGTGSFTAPFAGEHGWFWRNRDNEAVTVSLSIAGTYSRLVR